MHTRQERTFNIFVGEKIEIDGYAVTNLERKRGATREIETGEAAQGREESGSRSSEYLGVHS